MNSIKIKLSLIANLIAIFALIVLGIVSFILQKPHYMKALLKIKLTYLKSHNLPLKISVPQINLLLEL
ncbi:not available [Campylobacter jejuni]|nr:not available [Campylobacter jejuni]